MIPLPNIRVALVNDWYSNCAGGDRVNEQILNLFPNAQLFALVDTLPENMRSIIANRTINTSFMQNLPRVQKNFRRYLSLMTYAIESLDLSDYDLVISSSHAVAKGVITSADQLHICYCHTPTRLVWDIQHNHSTDKNAALGLFKKIKRIAYHAVLHHIRQWDQISAHRPDHFVANSNFTAQRISKYYRRQAAVIHPPVDVEFFQPDYVASRENYVVASRMLPYKRLDLIIDAFHRLPNRQLIVVGDGPEFKALEKRASQSPNITLTGYIERNELRHHLQRAKAFITMAKEDFGIGHIEAQACGTPVIAYAGGGALENIVPVGKEQPTGIYVREQSAQALIKALEKFEALSDPIKADDCVENAKEFDGDHFRIKFAEYISEAWKTFSITHKKPYEVEEPKAT